MFALASTILFSVFRKSTVVKPKETGVCPTSNGYPYDGDGISGSYCCSVPADLKHPGVCPSQDYVKCSSAPCRGVSICPINHAFPYDGGGSTRGYCCSVPIDSTEPGACPSSDFRKCPQAPCARFYKLWDGNRGGGNEDITQFQPILCTTSSSCNVCSKCCITMGNSLCLECYSQHCTPQPKAHFLRLRKSLQKSSLHQIVDEDPNDRDYEYNYSK